MTSAAPLSSRIPKSESHALPADVAGVTWRAATAADVDAIHALHRVADPIDHATFGTPRDDIAELFDSSWIDPTRDVVVGVQGDAIVAYGQSTVIPGTAGFAESAISGVVHPDSRGRGIGGSLLDWQQSRALEHLALVDEPVEGRVNAYTSSDQPALHRLLERRGFGIVRAFDELSRNIAEEIPDAAVPEGLQLMPYSARWSAATMDAKNETFADHWGSLPETVEHWEQRNTSAENGAGGLRTDASLLLVDGEEVVAFVLTTANEDDWERLGHPFGYITLVGVRRGQRGRGAAQSLLAAVLRRYRELGWERATLHVDTTSPTGADRLYRRVGFTPSARELVYGRTF